MTSLVKPLVLSSFHDRDKGRMTGIPPFAVEMIEKHFRIVWIEDFNANPEKYGKEVVAVFMGTKQPTVDKDLLEKLPNLKIVASMSAGYNHLDIPLIRSYGVRVSNTPYVLDNATADLGMALLLNAGRELYSNINFAMSPGTTHFDMNLMSGDVSGTTLGIVGMGRIGCKVAERARAFNMNILYHNRSKRNDDSAIGATYYSKLNDMLPHCDHIIITLPLTAETNKIIGAQQFKLMKSTSILINIARGALWTTTHSYTRSHTAKSNSPLSTSPTQSRYHVTTRC
uniref:D-isomer specific 2-hydroxyacid dehydrogenase NAD-binding domain-containing protein n=1 Tax=Ciona savignyi TaxID=51511 RepID=H2YH12_CIOSA